MALNRRIRRALEIARPYSGTRRGVYRLDRAFLEARAEEALQSRLVRLPLEKQKRLVLVLNRWVMNQNKLLRDWKKLRDAPHFVFYPELAFWASQNKNKIRAWKKSGEKSPEFLALAEKTMLETQVPKELRVLLGKKADGFWKTVSLGTLGERLGARLMGARVG